MAREAHGDRRESACAEIGDAILFGKDDGHRARPIGFGESVGAVGNILGDVRELCDIGDVDNQRVECRSFFGGENLGERFGLECVAGEPVNCFCRNGDNLSVFLSRQQSTFFLFLCT